MHAYLHLLNHVDCVAAHTLQPDPPSSREPTFNGCLNDAAVAVADEAAHPVLMR